MARYMSVSISINSLGAIPVSTDRLAMVYVIELRGIIFFLRLIPLQFQEYL
jgi:hypothetical protein